jgi:teichoic acid transport system ATP-binding protein
MNNIAIKVSHLTKVYKLYDKPIDRLKESLHPLKKQYHKDFYALNDINFEIKKGETVGIIGKNGAGKSTLLKIITGVLTPSSGHVHVNGRISSLLELGAGFNPEYTGIENIYLQGTLMGYSHNEMELKIDEILSFADIGDFVHQPVKMYSSGMFARLAFAVAINVEPDILIVDEALAVGDAGFVLKCMNKMKEIKEQGATILLVTHDTQSIKTFTSKSIWINNGKLEIIDNSKIVCERYMEFLYSSVNENIKNIDNSRIKEEQNKNIFLAIPKKAKRWGSNEIEIIGYKLYDDNGVIKDYFEWNENINIEIKAISHKSFLSDDLIDVGFAIAFRNKQGLDILVSSTIEDNIKLKDINQNSIIKAQFKISNILKPDEYFIVLAIEYNDLTNIKYSDFVEDAIKFKAIESAGKKIYSLVSINSEKKVTYEN